MKSDIGSKGLQNAERQACSCTHKIYHWKWFSYVKRKAVSESYSPTRIQRTQWGHWMHSSMPCSNVKKIMKQTCLVRGLSLQLSMFLIAGPDGRLLAPYMVGLWCRHRLVKKHKHYISTLSLKIYFISRGLWFFLLGIKGEQLNRY